MLIKHLKNTINLKTVKAKQKRKQHAYLNLFSRWTASVCFSEYRKDGQSSSVLLGITLDKSWKNETILFTIDILQVVLFRYRSYYFLNANIHIHGHIDTLSDSIIAVSYTHLDVYKRQTYCRPFYINVQKIIVFFFSLFLLYFLYFDIFHHYFLISKLLKFFVGLIFSQ